MGQTKIWCSLSYGQEALWFLWKLIPGTWAYNIVLPVGVRGRLDVAALRRAVQKLSDRHAALRTEFGEEAGRPRQRPLEGHQVLFEEVDAAGWDGARLEDALGDRARRPFDLEASAAMRTTLFRRAADHHVLLIVVHHIVCDLWSLIVVMDELRQLYAAEKAGRGCALSGLPVGYADVAREGREAMDTEAGERLWRYWRDELSGELPVLDLPADRPRPAMQSFRGGTITRRMDAELTGTLKRLAGRERVTLYMLLLAAYQVLLHRYTGQDRLVVGSPTSGRERPELEGVVGDFVNMVPLRADLSGAPTFRELLGRVRANVVATIRHQDYPFSLLVDRLRPARDLSRSPIFQTTFVLQRFHRFPELSRVMLPGDDEAPIPFADLLLEPLPLAQQDGQFDVNVEMKEDERGRLVAAWKYAADLFEPETIARMAAHFEALLASIVADPDRRIAELSFLNADERRAAIEGGTGRIRGLPGATVAELFEAQAQRREGAIAVTCGDASVTYGELRRRVASLARSLVARGVRRDTIVAVLMPRGIDFITALLAISKAAGAFLPLDPRHAPSRTAQIVADSGATLVLTTVAHDDASAGLPAVSADGLAYVMYTSGSTGAPKGVMVEHRGMVNHVLAKLADLEMGEDSVLAQNGPPTFDIVVWQCLAPLVVGGRVAVLVDEVADDPANLLAAIEAGGITVLQVVPSMLRAVLDEPAVPLTTLRWIVPTGEALPTALCRRWLGRYPGIPLLNTYGSTECSDDQCHDAIRRLSTADEGVAIASIGTPIFNMTAHVLDANLAPVPVGVVGELYIGGVGVGVGRGYLGDPERTAAAFVPDPFGSRPGARLYRTRDLARRRADGRLDFLGRVDAMIKLRGFRIEPGEIEAALGRHPAVGAAAVLARAHPSGDRVLVAYVVARAGAPPSIEELRRFLGERLPPYMVPSVVMFVEALPLTANGKLDAGRLPAPQWEVAEAGELIAPRTPAEDLIAAIWADVLGLDRVGVTQDFFAIGGDSIKSIQIVARCQRAGLHVRPSDLFQQSTVAGLAALAGGPAASAAANGHLPSFEIPQDHLELARAQVEFDEA
jgi:amino acid adenylation domain-containing protein